MMLDFGFYNEDCLKGMAEFPDKYFDLAIVDPPYGGGSSADANDTFNGAIQGRFGGRFEKYFGNDKRGHMGGGKMKKYGYGHWDIAPDKKYFDELFRVSKNQIIWGGNYFDLPPTRCFITWHKINIPEQFTMCRVENAWTSFNKNAQLVQISSSRDETSGKFHPTEKPIRLYEWVIANFAKDGDIILDTHVGSASSLIACRNTGHKYVGFEINEEYYRLAKKRLDQETAQMNIFDFMKGE